MDITPNFSLDIIVIIRTTPKEVVSKEKKVASKAPFNAVYFFSLIKTKAMFKSAVATNVIFFENCKMMVK